MATALGPALFAQHRGRVWAEIESALERLRSGRAIEHQVAKSVGLLQVLGIGAAAPASQTVILSGLKREGEVAVSDVEKAISSLEKRSILVYRRHADSYALWEGSDIDVEQRLLEARRHVDPSKGLAAFLSAYLPLRPIVAKAHSFLTGSLRYFDACYVDERSLGTAAQAVLGDSDGRVLYCIPASDEERRAMLGVLTSTKIREHAHLLRVGLHRKPP